VASQEAWQVSLPGSGSGGGAWKEGGRTLSRGPWRFALRRPCLRPSLEARQVETKISGRPCDRRAGATRSNFFIDSIKSYFRDGCHGRHAHDTGGAGHSGIRDPRARGDDQGSRRPGERDTSKTTTSLATLPTQSAALHSTPPASRTPHWSATHTTPRLSDSACPLVAQVWCLDWSPCGQIMATSGADKKLMIWAEQGGSFVCQVRLPRIQKSPPTQ